MAERIVGLELPVGVVMSLTVIMC